MSNLQAEALQQLCQSINLPASDSILQPSEALSLEDVRRFLVQEITRLLDNNPAMLMSILYRVDVAEADVKRVFADASPSELPDRLAGLLIERQMQKLRIRRPYCDT